MAVLEGDRTDPAAADQVIPELDYEVPYNPALSSYGRAFLTSTLRDWWRTWSNHRPEARGPPRELLRAWLDGDLLEPEGDLREWLEGMDLDGLPLD
ncbi:MAG: hypothetical protein ACKPKO_38485, partial [Candidatus Fonsibacter sp.]